MLRTLPISRAALVRAVLLPAVLGLAAQTGAGAQTFGPRATPVGLAPAANPTILAIGPGEAGTTRKVELSMGRSLVVELPRDAKEVFVANPKIANAVVRSTRKLFLIGMENGATSIFVMDADGGQIAAIDVTVGRDLDVLRGTLRASLPGARLDVRTAGNSIILSGTVASASEAQQAIDVANAFSAVGAGALGGTKGAVINNLTIRQREQVMLRVTIAEVSRTVVKQFGISTNAGWSALGRYVGVGNNANSAAPGVTPTWNSQVSSSFPINAIPDSYLQGGFQAAGVDVNATLRAFERAGVSRILAEPTLTAISGETAKFTAGGEIPVPASQSCISGTTGCTIGIEFKPYGVTLSFTPVVLAEGRISVRVGTDVTEIDPQQQIVVGTVAVPGTRKRSSETTVELPSGGVMMTAGLLQQTNKQAISGLPGLINLPILGALFRSRDYQRQETELMILVTPYIAKPMEPAQVQRPDDGFVGADDAQALLLGRFNKLYGTVGGAPAAGTYKGRVGFITD
jgi:pilus assembly protein CpaC